MRRLVKNDETITVGRDRQKLVIARRDRRRPAATAPRSPRATAPSSPRGDRTTVIGGTPASCVEGDEKERIRGAIGPSSWAATSTSSSSRTWRERVEDGQPPRRERAPQRGGRRQARSRSAATSTTSGGVLRLSRRATRSTSRPGASCSRPRRPDHQGPRRLHPRRRSGVTIVGSHGARSTAAAPRPGRRRVARRPRRPARARRRREARQRPSGRRPRRRRADRARAGGGGRWTQAAGQDRSSGRADALRST